MKNRKTKGGFTLLELLTVVVIIAILVGLTGTAAVAMRKKAIKKKREVQKETLASAAQAYLHEYNKWPVTHSAGYIDLDDIHDQLVDHKDLMDHMLSSLDPTLPGIDEDNNPRDIHFLRSTDFEIDPLTGNILDAVEKTPLKIYINLSNTVFWCENGDPKP